MGNGVWYNYLWIQLGNGYNYNGSLHKFDFIEIIIRFYEVMVKTDFAASMLDWKPKVFLADEAILLYISFFNDFMTKIGMLNFC